MRVAKSISPWWRLLEKVLVGYRYLIQSTTLGYSSKEYFPLVTSGGMIDHLSSTVSTRHSTKSQIYRLHKYKYTNTKRNEFQHLLYPSKPTILALTYPVIFIFTVQFKAFSTDRGKSIHYDMTQLKSILIHNDHILFDSWSNPCVFKCASISWIEVVSDLVTYTILPRQAASAFMDAFRYFFSAIPRLCIV